MSIDKIYWACIGLQNFGDHLSLWLSDKLTGREFGFSNDRELIISGSVLQEATPESVVYGAGYGSMFQFTQARYISYVRGHFTRQLLKQQGNTANPEVFEPAYCLREFFEDIQPDIDVGYIPHYIDADIYKPSDWHCIGICTGIENVIREMLRCKKIVTSSLHGMVIADLFERPSCLVRVSDKIAGDGFKYVDYWSFINATPYAPIPIERRDQIEAMLSRNAVKFDKSEQAKQYLQKLNEHLQTLCD